ncbi:unnamed protein product, partial [Prorocentrum cordatum]
MAPRPSPVLRAAWLLALALQWPSIGATRGRRRRRGERDARRQRRRRRRQRQRARAAAGPARVLPLPGRRQGVEPGGVALLPPERPPGAVQGVRPLQAAVVQRAGAGHRAHRGADGAELLLHRPRVSDEPAVEHSDPVGHNLPLRRQVRFHFGLHASGQAVRVYLFDAEQSAGLRLLRVPLLRVGGRGRAGREARGGSQASPVGNLGARALGVVAERLVERKAAQLDGPFQDSDEPGRAQFV